MRGLVLFDFGGTLDADGVVSNFTGNLDLCLEELGVMRHFSVVADSGRIGITKPDPRLVQHALNGLARADKPAWMVGDDCESDIGPAAALGLSTAWIAPPSTEPKAREPGVPTARRATWPELGTVRAP